MFSKHPAIRLSWLPKWMQHVRQYEADLVYYLLKKHFLMECTVGAKDTRPLDTPSWNEEDAMLSNDGM